jgi:hypothetical protein
MPRPEDSSGTRPTFEWYLNVFTLWVKMVCANSRININGYWYYTIRKEGMPRPEDSSGTRPTFEWYLNVFTLWVKMVCPAGLEPATF